MKNLSEVYKMRVEKRTCNIGEYLPLKRRLEKNGYTVGIGRIHLEFVSKHATRYRAGKFGIKKCFQPYRLHFYIRFEAIYKPNLAGNGVATPPAFLCAKPFKKSSLTSSLVQYFLKVVANKEM